MWPFRRHAASPPFADIEPVEACRRAEQGALLLDVRRPTELAGGRIPQARNVPLTELQDYASGLDRSTPIMLVCRSGSRSRAAAKRLAALGFADVHNVRGGIDAWRRAGLPLTADGRR